MNKILRRLTTDLLPKDIFELTLQRIKTKRFRYFLTVLGMGIGIGAVFFLVSLTFGLQQLVIGNIATSESLLTLDVVPNTEIKQFIKLDSQAMDEINKIEAVSEVSPVKSVSSDISYNKLKGQTMLYGVNPSFFRLSAIKPDMGILLDDKSEKKIVVSSAVLSLFNLSPDTAVGANVNISLIMPEDEQKEDENLATPSGQLVKSVEIPHQFEIIGIIEDTSSYAYILQENFDVIDYDEYQSAKIKIASREMIEEIRDEIISKGFFVTAMIDTLNQVNKIFAITQATFTIIGIVALLIAAIGMLNTMTVSLLERTREIGIMKAIGASEKGIKEMFLAESVLMGFGGGIAGLAVGFIFTRIVSILIKLLAVSLGGKPINVFFTPSWFIILILVFSLVIGLITGIFPAKRAAKLNPLDALRYE